MQEIDRHTIEAWLLDYQEGRLDDSQIFQLREFLAQHPDLNIDPDFSGFLTLQAPDIHFSNKEELYRTDLSIPEATEDDLECIAAMEGDLAKGQQAHFQKKLQEDTHLAARYAVFAKMYLSPAPDIRMKNKNGLYRNAIKMPGYVLYSALAAAAVLIIAFYIFRPISIPTLTDQPVLAADTTREVIYMNKLIHPGHFDQIAAREPQQAVSVQPQPELLESRDDIRMAALAPKQVSGIETATQVSQFAFVNRPDPFRSEVPYQTLWAYTGELIRKNILGQDPKQVKKTRFSLWEIADAGLEKASDVFSISADLDRQYNQEGELVEVSFSSPLLAFSTPVNPHRAQ